MHTWLHSYLNLDNSPGTPLLSLGQPPWVFRPMFPRWTLTAGLEDCQLPGLQVAVGVHCTKMVPTHSGCASSSHTCPQQPPWLPSHTPAVPAGRRAPIQRRLPAAGVRPSPPCRCWCRATGPSICPGSTTQGAGLRGGASRGRGLGRASRPAMLSRPLVAGWLQAGTTSPLWSR